MATDSEVTERTEVSQTEGSDKGTGQRGSEQEYITVQQFNELMTKFDQLGRSLQSEKDRAVKRTNERLDKVDTELKTLLNNAAQKGLSLNDLIADVERQEAQSVNEGLKELVGAWREGKLAVGGVGTQSKPAVNVSEVLVELGLDLGDVRVKDFAAKEFASKEEAYVAGAKLLKTIITKSPTDADQPSGTAQRLPAESKQQELMREYEEGSKGLRGTELINFKMQMRKKGLRIS